MKKTIVLFFHILLFVAVCYGQNNYRVKRVYNDKAHSKGVDMLLPPKAKIAGEGFIFLKRQLEFKTDTRFKYQSVEITGLGKNYENSVANIGRATYKSGKVPLGIPASLIYPGLFFKCYLLRDDHLIVEFNMDDLMTDLFNTHYGNENGLYEDLVQSLYGGLSQIEDNNWAPSISQNIVEKIFEMIPFPQQASLKRYMTMVGEDYSFTLLNPKIWLAVDNGQKIRPKLPAWENGKRNTNNADYWQFDLSGSTIVKFYRNREGQLRQMPFYNWQVNLGGHTNLLVDNPPLVLQASSGDIQFSGVLNAQKYIALFENSLKPNNQNTSGLADFQNIFAKENSELFFLKKIDPAFFQLLEKPDPASDPAIIASVFGLRNLIVPVIPVYLNRVQVPVLFNCDLYLLKQQSVVPDIKKLKVYRIYNGAYTKVSFINQDLLLLPDDRIEFK